MIIYQEIYNDLASILCKDFLAYKARRYVFGINDYALSVAYALDCEIAGFICDDTSAKSPIFGIDIMSLDSVPSDGLIISCVVLSQAINIINRLNALGFRNLDYFAFFKYCRSLDIKDVEFVGCNLLGKPFCLEDSRLDIERNLSCYEEIYYLLSDTHSKNTFEKCLNFRYSRDIRYMESFSYTPKTQYFEDFIPFSDVDMFIDIGAYHGETTLEFLRRNNKAICHCFEPESTNFALMQDNLGSFDNVYLHKYGVGIKAQSLYISKDNGSANKISYSNDMSNSSIEKIDIINIDLISDLLFKPSMITSKSFTSHTNNMWGGGGQNTCQKIAASCVCIKIDIEGEEINALRGMSRFITEYMPILAVSVYHSPSDFYTIAQYITSLNKNYKTYFRHYSQGLIESVMFFIPQRVL